MSYHKSEDVDLEKLNNIETGLDHVNEVRNKTTDIIQTVVSVSKTNSTLNFHRLGIDRLNKIRQGLDKTTMVFDSMHLIHDECRKTNELLDKTEEPHLPLDSVGFSKDGQELLCSTSMEITPKGKELERKKKHLEEELKRKQAEFKDLINEVNELQHMMQSAFPWQKRNMAI